MNSTAVPYSLARHQHDNNALAPVLKRLLRYAKSKVRNPALAEDAVSETLLAALESPRDFDSAARASAWLIGVLKHKLVDQLRKVHREQPAGDMTAECDREGLCWSGAWGDVRSAANDPERACQQQQIMTLLARACDSLPATQARAFEMHEVLDLDTNTICKTLGVSPGHLWVLTHRARGQLKLALRRQGVMARE
jgi:RNA polymerase sigma-70 factor (TIGR02943 family)